MTSPSPEDLSVGDSIPPLRVDELSRTQIVRYLGASGDFNPLHHDDEFARRGGQEGVIASGMLVAGLASSALTDWVPVRSVTRFRTRFVGTVMPGDALIVRGEVTSVTRNRASTSAEIDLTVEDGDGTVLSGDATVRF